MSGLHHMTDHVSDHVTIFPTSFRRSLSRATPALPLVVVRACIRVGRAEKALHYVREKVETLVKSQILQHADFCVAGEIWDLSFTTSVPYSNGYIHQRRRCS